MKYTLINSDGDWSISHVKRGSLAESRLVERLAFHTVGHPLVSNTPNYLVQAILDYSNHNFHDSIPKNLRSILIDDYSIIHFFFHD